MLGETTTWVCRTTFDPNVGLPPELVALVHRTFPESGRGWPEVHGWILQAVHQREWGWITVRVDSDTTSIEPEVVWTVHRLKKLVAVKEDGWTKSFDATSMVVVDRPYNNRTKVEVWKRLFPERWSRLNSLRIQRAVGVDPGPSTLDVLATDRNLRVALCKSAGKPGKVLVTPIGHFPCQSWYDDLRLAIRSEIGPFDGKTWDDLEPRFILKGLGGQR